MEIENLDWNKQEMQRALLGLSKSLGRTKALRLHESHSRARLQTRLNETLAWMSALGFEARPSNIEKVVGLVISPVWRVEIEYRYEPYHFAQLPLPSPSS